MLTIALYKIYIRGIGEKTMSGKSNLFVWDSVAYVGNTEQPWRFTNRQPLFIIHFVWILMLHSAFLLLTIIIVVISCFYHFHPLQTHNVQRDAQDRMRFNEQISGCRNDETRDTVCRLNIILGLLPEVTLAILIFQVSFSFTLSSPLSFFSL